MYKIFYKLCHPIILNHATLTPKSPIPYDYSVTILK